METLVVVEQHRNQYCGRMNVKHYYGAGRVVSRAMTLAQGFEGNNCRIFQSGAGILPTPDDTKRGNTSYSALSGTPSRLSAGRLKSSSKSDPIDIKSKPSVNNMGFGEEPKSFGKSAPIAIKTKSPVHKISFGEKERSFSKSAPIAIKRKSLMNNVSFGVEEKIFANSVPVAIKSKSLVDKINFGDEMSNISVSFSELWAGPTYSNSPPPSSLPMPKISLLPKRSVSLELPRSAQDFEIELPELAKSAPSALTRENRNEGFVAHKFATKDLCRMLNIEIANN